MKKYNVIQSLSDLDNIVQVLQVRAEISPHEKVIGYPINYKKLNTQAKEIAAHIQEIARPEQKAILFYNDFEEVLPIFFATWFAGLVAVPVDFTQIQHPNYLSQLLTVAKPALFLTSTSLYGIAKNLLADISAFTTAWPLLTDEVSSTPRKWCEPCITDNSAALLEYYLHNATLVETTHASLMQYTPAVTDITTYRPHLNHVLDLLKIVNHCKQYKVDFHSANVIMPRYAAM